MVGNGTYGQVHKVRRDVSLVNILHVVMDFGAYVLTIYLASNMVLSYDKLGTVM